MAGHGWRVRFSTDSGARLFSVLRGRPVLSVAGHEALDLQRGDSFIATQRSHFDLFDDQDAKVVEANDLYRFADHVVHNGRTTKLVGGRLLCPVADQQIPQALLESIIVFRKASKGAGLCDRIVRSLIEGSVYILPERIASAQPAHFGLALQIAALGLARPDPGCTVMTAGLSPGGSADTTADPSPQKLGFPF